MSDDKSPFQIRDFRIATREVAKACANRAGLTMAEWMDRAVHSQARIDEQESVFPPGVRPPPPDDAPLINLITASASLAAQEVRGLRSVPGLVALLADRVRDARGLPARQTRVKPTRQYGKTGQTDAGFDAIRFKEVGFSHPQPADSETPDDLETPTPPGSPEPNGDAKADVTLTSTSHHSVAPASTPEMGEGELCDIGGEMPPCHQPPPQDLPPMPADC